MPEEPKPSFVKRLFGEFHWTPPPWARAAGVASVRGGAATRDFVKRHRVGVLVALAGLVELGGAGYAGNRWWEARPKPLRLALSIQDPGLTSIEENPTFRPVRIKFGGSAARLGHGGKRGAKGAALAPTHPGDWHWSDDHTLVFEPTQDWPVGQ